MWEKTWIGVTGQQWKVWVSLGLLVATIVAFVAMWRTDHPELFFGLAMLFLALVLAWILWTFLSFRCPFCSARPVWIVLRHLHHEVSLEVAFFSLTNCPSCKGSFFGK